MSAYPHRQIPPAPARDRLRRPLRDLRISVTDRCNFRCAYCMPKEQFHEHYQFLPRTALLSFEEIARIASIAARLGVEKLRITGGEPLLRRDLAELVAMLRAVPGIRDLALTTNGLLLPKCAAALRAAGLGRVTVSLDSLDDEIFGQTNGMGVRVASVLDGIQAAVEAGFAPVKVNMVVRRSVNDREVVDIAGHFRGTGVIVRFIEYMDAGVSNGWERGDVVPADEILARVDERYPIRPLAPSREGEVAQRYVYEDGAGEIGVIASVTRPFCGGCTRLRLSSDGKLYTCLFASEGLDLRDLIRGGAHDGDIEDALAGVWGRREDRYSELRAKMDPRAEKIEMFYIGG